MDPPDPPSVGRGFGLLLAHCAFFTDVVGESRTPRERLEDAVGGEFARLLVGALSGDKGRGRFRIPA